MTSENFGRVTPVWPPLNSDGIRKHADGFGSSTPRVAIALELDESLQKSTARLGRLDNPIFPGMAVNRDPKFEPGRS